MFEQIKIACRHLIEVPDDVAPARYASLRRIMTVLMVVVSVMPLLVLTGINHVQYQHTLQGELEVPLRGMVGKTRTSLGLFLTERASTVSLIAQAYSFDDLSDPKTLTRIFRALKSEFQGFVDLGLVDETGRQVGYVGPYNLRGAEYGDQPWLHHAQVKGAFISDVFLGLRGTPHIVIAVSHMEENGRTWVVRATIDTAQLDRLVAAMGLSPDADAFLVNTQGIMQTSSRLYGGVLHKLPLPVPPVSYDTSVTLLHDAQGQELVAAYAYIQNTDFIVMALKPHSALFQPWTTLQSDLLLLLACSVALIVFVSHVLMKQLVNRLQASDERRVAAFAQMEHNQKLSSIGRLAAGVAHEVNNPLAIINEKAGLALDFLNMTGDFPKKDRLTALLQGIESSVDRARNITHRLLGFARRMEANRQELHLEEVLTETLGFLEREAQNRGVTISTSVAENLPALISDRGQLQQVFLNIIGNALAAVDNGGTVQVRCTAGQAGFVHVEIEDNGKGMPPEVLRHIFEPFFTTKQEKGNGLGMFITYGIIKRLGGEIHVASEDGKGTTIRILLPLVPPEGQENPALPNSASVQEKH
jgi:two-component system, NtrC family, sensor kinase